MDRRAFLGLTVGVPLGMGIAGCRDGDFYFVQMADTQLGMIAGGDGSDFTRETAILQAVFGRIATLAPTPAFVVVCGDMTNTPGHAAQIAEYRRLTGLLGPSIPCREVSGNHDFRGEPTPDAIARYRAIYGPDRYAFDERGWHFVVLNSTLMRSREQSGDEWEAQLAWARDDLAAASGSARGSVVFMHHPFFDDDIDEEDGYNGIPRADRHMWLDLFAENGVAAVYSGHRHTTIPEHVYRGVRLVNTNAVCNSFDDSAGLRIVRVSGATVSDTFYRSDAIPRTAAMVAHV